MTTHTARPYRGMTPDERTEERRLRLLAAGRQCFAEVGGAPLVADVCARAGVSKRHFYELFDDRLDLVLALHTEALAWARDVFDDDADPADPAAWLARLVPSLCAKLLEDPARGDVLARVPALYTEPPDNLARLAVEGLVRRVGRVADRPKVSQERVRRHAVGAVFAGRAVLVEWWLVTDGPRRGRVMKSYVEDVVSVSTAALSPVLP